MLKWDDAPITDGTDHAARISPALQPGYFNVDEMAFEQLLSMGADFASQVNYYNLKNEVDGNWGDLLTSDEAVIMAMILSRNLQKMESHFLSLVELCPAQAVDFIVQTAKSVNFWVKKLERHGHDAGGSLAYKLNGLIEDKLAKELHCVVHLASLIPDADEYISQVDFDEFTSLWKIKKQLGISGNEKSRYVFPLASQFTHCSVNEVKAKLGASFYGFYHAFSYMKTITPIHLKESMASQEHDPANGLYILFLKLYEKSQALLNQFTQRHLDFYYSRILQAKVRPPLPESAYLLLEVLPGIAGTLIEKGRPFSAGRGENVEDILYTANYDSWVSDVKVADIHTIYLQHNKLIYPECELGYATRIKQSSPLFSVASDDFPKPWPLLGDNSKITSLSDTQDAVLGFSIASPLLLLKAGERRIKLSIIFDSLDTSIFEKNSDFLQEKEDAEKRASEEYPVNPFEFSFNPKEKFMRRFGEYFARHLLSKEGALDPSLHEEIMREAEETIDDDEEREAIISLLNHRSETFNRLMENVFHIQITGEDEWLQIEEYFIGTYDDGDEDSIGITLSFDLTPELGDIISHDPALHDSDLVSEHPVIKCSIGSQTNFYPYTLFNHLLLKAFDIEVTAKRVSDIQIHNNHGQLDPSKPFLPFGPLPNNNAYMIIGNYELVKKQLVELNLNLEWGEIPSGKGGFSQHYTAYENHYDNQKFKVSLEYLVDGQWLPKESTTEHLQSLFDSKEEDELKTEKVLSINVQDYTKPIPAWVVADEYQYTVASRTGFFKLSLREPEGAFGHAEYPALLTNTLMKNAILKNNTLLPNVPYTPLLNRVTLDYRAHSRIEINSRIKEGRNTSGEQVFHHHPFGITAIYPNLNIQSPRLFPQYEFQGNLYIGLSAKELHGSVTLFFHLREDNGQESISESARFSWYYLSHDGWCQLTPKQITRDTTKGFLSSGIISFNLPNDLDNQNSEMPKGLYWLRLSSEKGVKAVCSCFNIFSNVLPVTRELQENVAYQETASAGASWQSMATIPGIGSVQQIGSLFGGRAQEGLPELKIRLSEQLRHKNRASSPWDYERLILDNFPSVAKVKCFPNRCSSKNSPTPGHVLLVVVPRVDSRETPLSSREMVSSVELSHIREFLHRHTSSFVKLEVRNPVYEQIQIRCTVKFTASMSSAAWGNRLDRDISEYLSPWRQAGNRSGFGWAIRKKDIESYTRELEYIEYVTNFSMLHITTDAEGDFFLGDTARKKTGNEMIITPRYPWSLPIPTEHHAIETTRVMAGIKANVTGVNELEIGSTFIISGNDGHGEKE